MQMHDKVRRCQTCVACGCEKNAGLLLCWPCHREQKRINADQAFDYDPNLTSLFDLIEDGLIDGATAYAIWTSKTFPTGVII